MAARQQVVVVSKAAVFDEQHETPKAAAHREENPLRTMGRNVHLRRDGVGTVLYVSGSEEVDGGAARAVDVAMTPAPGPRPGTPSSRERRLKGQDVVAGGLDPPQLL